MPLIEARKKYTFNPNLETFEIHTHTTYEIFCFLSGKAKYYVEGNIYNLKPGDILIMKKAEAHSLLISADIPYERITVNFNNSALLNDSTLDLLSFFDNKPLGKNNRFAASKFNNTNWIYYLENICNSNNEYEKRIYLTILLNELCNNYCNITDDEIYYDNISLILDYINQHITKNITLDQLCNHFHISQAQLNRKFNKMVGTTVYKYITTKRLLLAKELLKGGKQPTAIYNECGFNDYCTFYKAYKEKFKVSPKLDFVNSKC